MPSQRKTTHAPDAPAPNGNYSHVVHAGGLLHVCGWMGDVPETGLIIEGGIEAQTVFTVFHNNHLDWPTDDDVGASDEEHLRLPARGRLEHG